MIVENLNNNVMLVELSVDEMKEYDITYETLNNQDRKNQVAIKNLLEQIDQRNILENGGKVIVEAMPIDGGGCFFIFTFQQLRKRYKLKTPESVSFYRMENLNDLLTGLNGFEHFLTHGLGLNLSNELTGNAVFHVSIQQSHADIPHGLSNVRL